MILGKKTIAKATLYTEGKRKLVRQTEPQKKRKKICAVKREKTLATRIKKGQGVIGRFYSIDSFHPMPRN